MNAIFRLFRSSSVAKHGLSYLSNADEKLSNGTSTYCPWNDDTSYREEASNSGRNWKEKHQSIKTDARTKVGSLSPSWIMLRAAPFTYPSIFTWVL